MSSCDSIDNTMDSSCDLIDNRMVEYEKQIDEFINYETELLGLYRKHLNHLLNPSPFFMQHMKDFYSQNEELIEITRNAITDNTNSYSFLMNLKTDYYELVRHSVFDSKRIIVQLKDVFDKSGSKNYNYPTVLIKILEGKPTCDLIRNTILKYGRNIPTYCKFKSDFFPIFGRFRRDISRCYSVEKPCSSALCALFLNEENEEKKNRIISGLILFS